MLPQRSKEIVARQGGRRLDPYSRNRRDLALGLSRLPWCVKPRLAATHCPVMESSHSSPCLLWWGLQFNVNPTKQKLRDVGQSRAGEVGSEEWAGRQADLCFLNMAPFPDLGLLQWHRQNPNTQERLRNTDLLHTHPL